MATQNLLGRVPTADEVGRVIAFLASPAGELVNGDAVAVGGGSRGPIFY
jgi:NAD(P)-dependent dehydrogenase (short-subunit alcohol dehydrogenase family)